MKISTKGRYALRLMLELANNTSGMPIRLRDAAHRQNISEKYLEQIISVLNKAGYVRSIRGPQGGYVLTKRPEEYTVGMILRQTEGSLAPVACAEQNGACEQEDCCATRVLWKKLNDAVNEVVDHVTLEELVNWQQAKADEPKGEAYEKNISDQYGRNSGFLTQ